MSEHVQASKQTANSKKQATTGRARQSGRIASQLGRDRIQAKSPASNDAYELEADRIAREIAGDSTVDTEVAGSSRPPKISLLPAGKSSSRETGEADESADIVREVRQNSGGEPLPPGERAFFEERFQHDFSDVRLHRDGRADILCSRLKAEAFTFGNAIYFRSAGYRPGQSGSRQLLAHELTHVVQQGRAGRLVQRKSSPGAASGSDTAADAMPASENNLPRPDQQVQADHANQEQLQADRQQQQKQEADAQQAQEQSLDQIDQTDTGDLPDAIPEDEVVVELPEQPEPEPEKVAEIATVDFGGSSDEAMLSYTDASPSSMARSQPDLGKTLDGKIKGEAKEESESVPELVAKASGQEDLALVSPEPLAEAGKADLKGSEAKGDSKKLEPGEHRNKGDAPDNKENTMLLDQQESGGFLGWFRKRFSSFMNRIRTTDSGLNTSAGERPKVGLDGDADPGRANTARSEAGGEIGKQRDETANALRTHPGQSNIKARAVEESKKPEISRETAVDVAQEKDQGMAEYADMPLPEDVRLKSDELLQPGITNNVAEARKQTADAATTKETDKKKEIDHAQTEAQKLNQKADDDQKTIVMENRGKVAEQQRQGIKDANDAVADYNKESGEKQKTLSKDVREEVKKGEEKADGELRKGEEKADKKREEEEEKAASKKKELEKEQENDSWWDRAVDAVKSAVKAITDAIDDIFNALRKAVADIIDAAKQLAVDAINAARDWVVEQIDDFRDWAKEQVDTYLKDTFPGLAKTINDGIDVIADTAIDGVNAVANTLIEGVEALADGLAAALDKILSVYQAALKAAVQIAGAVLTGDFAEALRAAIQAACDIAGIDSKPIFDFIDRAKSAVMTILKDPVAFFMNIVKGVGGGVKNFAKNIKKHLINGLIGWLTGALSEVPITLPEKFDFKGILHLALQILGLTYENIKARVIKRFPPAATVIEAIETGVDIIKRIITEGPIAIWNMVKESLSNLKEMVLTGIRNFVIVTVVKEAVGWLLGLLSPAGAIVKVVKLLFDFTMFLIERFQQIKDFIMSVYGAITAIASGQLSKVMSAVEDAMARSLPVVISMLASLAGLGGIGKTVQNIIGKVSKPVNKVIDKIIDKVVGFAKKLLGKGKKGDKKDPKDKDAKKEDAQSGSLGAINLADLNKPPVPTKRTAAEKKTHYDRVMKILEIAGRGAKSTDDLEKHFPKIKKRYRLAKIEYDKGGGKKLGVKVKLNPEGYFFKFADNMMVKADDGDEAVKANQINHDPQNITIRKTGSSDKRGPAGAKMTAEYLDFNHPQGAHTKSTEQKELFAYLPTVGEGNARYIRGHLLNAELGGRATPENLFPITHQANVDHKNKIETEAKNLVNKEGYLVYYSVKVDNLSYGEDATYAYVNSDFICELATYEANNGTIEKSDKVKKATIKSRYKVDKSKTQAEVEGSVEKGEERKIRNFDKSQVKHASNIQVKYLSEMSKADLLAIKGIGPATVEKIWTAWESSESIRTEKKLKSLIGNHRTKLLQDAGFELRLYRSGS